MKPNESIDRGRSVGPAIGQTGHFVYASVFYRINRRPIGVAQDCLISVCRPLCNNDLRIPLQSLLHGHGGLPIARLCTHISHIDSAGSIKHIGAVRTCRLGSQTVVALSVVKSHPVFLRYLGCHRFNRLYDIRGIINQSLRVLLPVNHLTQKPVCLRIILAVAAEQHHRDFKLCL